MSTRICGALLFVFALLWRKIGDKSERSSAKHRRNKKLVDAIKNFTCLSKKLVEKADSQKFYNTRYIHLLCVYVKKKNE